MRPTAVPFAGFVLGALMFAAPPPALADPGAAGAAPDTSDNAALSQALGFDPASPAPTPPQHVLPVPTIAAPAPPDVRGDNKPDGSGSVAIKQPLPTDWDSAVGVDLNVAAPPPLSYQPDRPLPGGRGGTSSGAAWASVGLPNLASVDARIDPGSDQGRIGTTLQHSITVGEIASLTLRNRFAVSGDLGVVDTSPTAPIGLPMMTLPQAAAGASPTPVWSDERGVSFNILPTGTTLAAGLASASNDPTTHNRLSAEQELYGPLHVTTSVSDLGEARVNKSITAGFTLKW